MRVQAHPIPGATGDITAWNIASFYAPKELGEFIRDTEKISGAQGDSTQLRGQDLSNKDSKATSLARRSVEQDPQLSGSPTFRYEKLIQQVGSESIDETITGVIPAFEELGWAEYASLGIDAQVNNKLEATVEPGADDISSQKAAKNIGARENVSSDEIVPTSEKYLAGLAQYKLDLRRHVPRALEGVRGPYNPNLVAGFPGVVFTKRAIFTGEISSLNHAGGSGAQAYTTITLGAVRELSMVPGIYRANGTELLIFEAALHELLLTPNVVPTYDSFFQHAVYFKQTLAERHEGYIDTSTDKLRNLSVGFDPVDKAPTQPEWLNKSYRPEAIGKEVYRPLFGDNVKSLLELTNEDNVNFVASNMVVAANLFLIQYLRATDKVIFTEKLTRRDIATAKQVMKDFLGMARAPDEKSLDRAGEFSPDDLATSLAGLTAVVESTKSRASETIKAPKVPFHPARVTAVSNYLQHITGAKGKAFRG